jgi:hypothetical protein
MERLSHSSIVATGLCTRYTRRHLKNDTMFTLETKSIPRDIDFLAEADARISAVRSGMGEEAWKEALAEGRAMTLDEAVSNALEEEAGA